jgi:aminopeptidase N
LKTSLPMNWPIIGLGNLVTCETAGDMWINEGMAEFVSHQYQELVYDRERYEEVVLANHDLVLNRAVIDDGGHFALYGLPNELTYGTHTYQKGAMVAHNLRTYLGDPAFYNGLQTLLLLNAYSTLNSYQFRDQLANITGSNLTSFFDDWIFNPGYPEFNIDSTRVFYTAIPEPRVNVGVSQRQFATTKPFTNVPLRITLRDSAGQTQHHEVLYRGGDTVFSSSMHLNPNGPTSMRGATCLQVLRPLISTLPTPGCTTTIIAKWT